MTPIEQGSLVLSLTTVSAAVVSITDLFLPMAQKPGLAFKGCFNTCLAAGLMACVGLVWREVVVRWRTGLERRVE